MATIPEQQEPETTVRPDPNARWRNWKPTSLRMKEGFYVSGSFANNPQVQQIHRGQTLNVLQPQQMEQIKNTFTPNPDVYWDNPVRVARYYNFLRAQPPGYQAPEWLDTQQVNAAYNYLKYKNNDRPWTEWKPLQQDDPGKEFIRNMPAPPNDMRFGQEPLKPDQPTTVQSSTSEPFGDWNNLNPWQQIMLGIFSPQPGLANRPEATRLTASAFQGVMAGLGGAAVGAAIGGVPGALIGGVGVGLGTTYQTYTGNEVPVLSQALMLFDLPAQWLEQGIGVGAQIATDGLDEVMQNLPAAWEAGQLTYETAQADLTNLVAQIAGDEAAGPGEVWQIQKGLSDPQKLQAERGTAALNAARKRIEGGEDITAVYLDYVERFGFTGTLNDFVGQSLLDPTQLAPFIEGRAGGALADLAGNKRLAAAFRDTTGSPLIDVLPMGLKQIAEAVTGQHESAGLMGAIETYKNYIKTGYFPEGTTPLAPDQLSGFEKRIAGLDEQGRIKEMQPASGKGGVAGFVEYINNLTPEAKANVFLDNMLDNLKFLLAEADGDPDAMVDILNRAAGITPTQAGQAGERLIKSPYTATAAAAYYDFLKTGMTKELLAEWHAGDARRPLLEKIAKALDETPAEIIRQANDNIDVLARRVNERAPGLGEPKFIAEMLKPFTGDDAIPYDPVQFQAKLTNVMFDQSGEWLVKRFGIKQAGAVTRIMGVLKSAQSMLLLNLNPSYFLNNAINNVATRAAVGVFGFWTPGKLNKFLNDFGITPERLSEGVTPTGEVAGQAGRVISDVVKGNDAITQAQRIVSAVSDKIGIFSRASAAVEGMESKQAYVIGMSKFYNKAWRKGKGFDRMSDALVIALEREAPGSSAAIYAAVEAGMNWKDIERSITGEITKPAIGEILDAAAQTINPENPDAARELIDTTGVRQELETRLQNAETPQQAAAAFNAAEEKLQDFIDETFKRELVTRAEDVKAQVQKEGYPAALGLFTDLQVKIAMHWLQHLEDMENLFNKGQARAPGADMNDAISNSLQLAEREWSRLNSFELQTTAGILKAIGIESEAAGKFTDLMGQLHNGWKKFFEDRNARYREVFNMKKNRGENYADFQVRKNKAYRQASEQISRDFQKMAERENRLNEQMSNVFAKAFEQSTKMSGDGARAWRQRVIELRKQMQREMTEFRNTIQGMDGDARRQAWADFQPRYRELVVQLKEIEIEGAHQLARQPMSDTITKAMRDKLRNAGYDNKQIRNMTPEQINFELAKMEGRETQDLTNPQAKAILDMAKAAGAVDKNGDPVPQYALNIINRRSETKYDDLAKVPLDVAQKAMDAHQRKHRHEAARKKIREIINARNILDMADADARENALRAEGLMSRRMVREMLANEINATPEQVDAAIVAMDAHADALTLNAGGTPTEATRDAWYAQHWANENDSGGGTQLFQFEKPPASGDLHPWAKIAKDHFGVTDNIREAGFILPDGTMLDLSGRHYASGFTKRGDRWVAEPGQRDYLRNQRDVDHRDLPEEIQAPPGTFEWQDNNSNTANMLYFLNQSGAVRIDYNSGMITIGAPITTAQASILSNWFSDGWIEVDSPTTGEQIWDQEFSGAKRTKMRSLLAEANDRIVSASGGGATEARIESLRQDFISGLTNYYEGNDGNPYRALDYAMGSIVELARQGKTPAQLQQLLTENGFGKLPAEKLMQGIRYARALAEEGTLRQNQRGSISFLEDGRAILRGLQSPDVTTMMHEIGHVFRADLNDADTGVIAQWGGLTNGEELRDLTYQFRDGTISEADRARYVAAEEKFAQGWEEYLARGDAPTPELRNIFQRFTDWFKQIYGDLKRRFGKVDIDATVAGVKISDVMDRMLTVKPNRTDALAQAVGPATPPPPPRNPMHVAIADGKVADLPDHVSTGMRDVATWLEGEIARSKISLITDADTGETTRIWEDGPYWYRQMLDKMIENEKNSGSKKVDAEVKAEAEAAGETVDEQINSGNLKDKLISALKQIAKGKENPNLKRVQLAKGLIIDAALGNFGELESRATASLQWAWGDKEGVFTDWGDNIYDEAWLTQNFGPEADDVLTEYLLWQSDQNPIQQETTSAVDQVEAEWTRNQEAADKFETGAPIPIDDLPAEITPGPPADESPFVTEAKARILNGLEGKAKKFAIDMIDAVMTGSDGEDIASPGLPFIIEMEILKRVDDEADLLQDHMIAIPLDEEIKPAGDTIQAARVHSFEHGDNTIAAAIYHNGEVVALLPDNADVASQFETDAGPARLLGLDPDDPTKWIVEKDGKVESIDPERPELGNRAPAGGTIGMNGEFYPGGTFLPNTELPNQPASDQPTAPLPEQPAPVMGEVPMGATPSPEPAGETLNEIGAEHVRPMLRKMQEEYINRLGQAPYRWDSLSQETQAELRRYMNKVKDQQASTKYATMKYGEQMRDSALLNYSRRYGIDTYLNMVFPYQFWYTRSMMNWAKRMIDRPSWFAMYARMQQAQEKMERNGMPTRLKGKMRMPAPWLPDWAGGGLWVDPASKLLPFATFGQPFEQYASDRNMIAKRAETILQDMVDGDQITTSQMQEALRTRQGKAWEMATSQAQVELDKNGNPVNLVGMMMSPALYWSAPAALLEGKPEKISVMPITRTGQAIRTATQGTGLQGIGNFIGNALAMPEEKIRGAAGLSNFGEWGDYLIDRTLANMAADGTIDNDAARIAMIERQGPAYEEAYRRVEYEQMLRTPGAATLQQVAQGNIKGAAQSLPTVLLSGGLFPEGELKLRGLKGEYDKAWLDYKNGDEKALNNFFDAHPEYESRLALYTEPEDRLKKFLIGEVWDRYSSLEKTNRALASKELGATFRDAFLNSDTRSYDSIDVETLSMWAQQLGGSSPNVPETAGAMDTQVMDMYPPEFNQVIEDYQGARAEQFPNYYALQQEYYSLPEKSYQRRQFLKRFPELKDYWTWNRAYKEQHPEINQYYDDIYGDQPDTLSDQEFSRVDPVVLREVYFATLTGSDISTAVNRELTRLAKQSGMTVEEYQAALLATFAQSQMTQ